MLPHIRISELSIFYEFCHLYNDEIVIFVDKIREEQRLALQLPSFITIEKRKRNAYEYYLLIKHIIEFEKIQILFAIWIHLDLLIRAELEEKIKKEFEYLEKKYFLQLNYFNEQYLLQLKMFIQSMEAHIAELEIKIKMLYRIIKLLDIEMSKLENHVAVEYYQLATELKSVYLSCPKFDETVTINLPKTTASQPAQHSNESFQIDIDEFKVPVFHHIVKSISDRTVRLYQHDDFDNLVKQSTFNAYKVNLEHVYRGLPEQARNTAVTIAFESNQSKATMELLNNKMLSMTQNHPQLDFTRVHKIEKKIQAKIKEKEIALNHKNKLLNELATAIRIVNSVEQRFDKINNKQTEVLEENDLSESEERELGLDVDKHEERNCRP
ncbi:MAG: hypothetical protein P4M12_08040 [Gammaproteobacteria bacterium]|nr:hypothetical protein [Gammaproteobacteria bacterium]